MRDAIVFSLVWVLGAWCLGCDGNPSLPPSSQQSRAPVFCDPFAPAAGEPMSIERARDAHRWAELRRHLRMREALDPGHFMRQSAAVADPQRIDAGEVSCKTLRDIGRLLFTHDFTAQDGHTEPLRRVHRGDEGGPETHNCRSCHWRGGEAGAGAVLDNIFLLGDGDRISSADPRNPPPLLGLALVQMLAQEMSASLEADRAQALRRARATGEAVAVDLQTKGVSFGRLVAMPDGTLDTSGVEGVDADLVVKPFGWKGNFSTMRQFVRDSVSVHFRLPTERDGVPLTEGQVTSLLLFLATLPLPQVTIPERIPDLPSIAEPIPRPPSFDFSDDWSRGHALFESAGCAGCHRPTLVLDSPVFVMEAGPSGWPVAIDLSQDIEPPLLSYDAGLGGYPVHLFSDLKRHNMGPEAASQHVHRGVAVDQYLTRRLWGLNGSAPYFHDGRAPFIDHAIAAHTGEGEAARRAFESLDFGQKADLRIFLMSMRRPLVVTIPD